MVKNLNFSVGTLQKKLLDCLIEYIFVRLSPVHIAIK